MQSRGIVVLALVAGLAWLGCKKAGDGDGSDGIDVVTSIFPVYDLTRRVGGEAVTVQLLLQPGQSPHGFSPTTGQVKRVARAKLAFIVGLELDEWTARTVEAAGGGARLVRLGDRVETAEFDVPVIEEGEAHGGGDHGGHDHGGHDHGGHDHAGHDHGGHGHAGHDHAGHDHAGHAHAAHDADDHGRGDHGHDDHDHDADEPAASGEHAHQHHHGEGPDPHIWLSVPHAIAMVEVIAEELATTAPAHAATFRANAAVIIGVLGSTAGLILSFYVDIPSGATVILTLAATFAATLALRRLAR